MYKSLKLVAALLLCAGPALLSPAPSVAQVNQLDAEFNVIPDKFVLVDSGIRLTVCLVAIPNTSQCIDSVDLQVGTQKYPATDIDPIDFKRAFQFEETGVQVLEIDFPYKKKLPKGSTLIFHTPKGDVKAPARQ